MVPLLHQWSVYVFDHPGLEFSPILGNFDNDPLSCPAWCQRKGSKHGIAYGIVNMRRVVDGFGGKTTKYHNNYNQEEETFIKDTIPILDYQRLAVNE